MICILQQQTALTQTSACVTTTLSQSAVDWKGEDVTQDESGPQQAGPHHREVSPGTAALFPHFPHCTTANSAQGSCTLKG